jgi:hypothetical protein
MGRPSAVELLRRYSNRPDLLGPLVRALKVIDSNEDDIEVMPSVQSPAPTPSRNVKDRFTERELAEMAALYTSPGCTGEAVAEKYGINVRTVRRVMRERGVRKRA